MGVQVTSIADVQEASGEAAMRGGAGEVSFSCHLYELHIIGIDVSAFQLLRLLMCTSISMFHVQIEGPALGIGPYTQWAQQYYPCLVLPIMFNARRRSAGRGRRQCINARLGAGRARGCGCSGGLQWSCVALCVTDAHPTPRYGGLSNARCFLLCSAKACIQSFTMLQMDRKAG